MKKRTATFFCIFFAFSFFGHAREVVVRVGFFPNITQAQALIAANMSREEGKGWFEKRLGEGTKIEWFAFNAGPSAMEAIFAKSLDFTYVGPSPALNAYLRSNGKEIRVLSGATYGGDALVVRKPEWKSTTDLRGKTICTPQLGNTQDIACRVWFINQGLRVTLTGGDVRVIPMANPDIFTQFSQGTVDGAWTVEPWVTRLIEEAKGHILYLPAEESLPTTILVSRANFLKEHADLAQKFVLAHRELTDWINTHPEEAQKRVCEELSLRMKKEVPLSLIHKAWQRLRFDNAIEIQPFKKLMADARLTGLSRAHSDLSNLLVQEQQQQPTPLSSP